MASQTDSGSVLSESQNNGARVLLIKSSDRIHAKLNFKHVTMLLVELGKLTVCRLNYSNYNCVLMLEI